MITTGRIVRLAERDRAGVHFFFDGQIRRALEGDTVLTAMLASGHAVAHHAAGELAVSEAPSTRIVIVGAGPAGIRAAAALVDAGLHPVVIDEGQRAGGQIYRRPPDGFVRTPEHLYGSEAAKARALHALPILDFQRPPRR